MRTPRRFAVVSREAPVVARACRATGLAFLEGSRAGWSKRELDQWLTERYAVVSVGLGAGEDVTPESSLPPRNVAELVELVGVAVTAALRDIATDPGSVIDAALRAGAVVSIKEEDGELWMPVDRPDIDIETRVLSLFATDYLLNPETYEDELSVCDECDHVSFDVMGTCPRCASSEHSGIRRVELFDAQEKIA